MGRKGESVIEFRARRRDRLAVSCCDCLTFGGWLQIPEFGFKFVSLVVVHTQGCTEDSKILFNVAQHHQDIDGY